MTPIELDSVRAKAIRAEIPEALYESGKSQLSVRIPKDPGQRFPAIVRAADVLLAVTREAEPEPGVAETAAAYRGVNKTFVGPGPSRRESPLPSLRS